MDVSLKLRLPRDSASIPVVRRVATAAMCILGVAARCVDDLGVAITEAATNVLVHSATDDNYDVSVGISDWLCVVEVIDRGGHFPGAGAHGGGSTELAETGRGVDLMRALVDDVHFAVHRNGATVRMTKELQFEPDAPGERLARASSSVPREPETG